MTNDDATTRPGYRPLAFPQATPPDRVFRSELLAWYFATATLPSRRLAHDDAERRSVLRDRLAARTLRRAAREEDYRPYWEHFGEVPDAPRHHVPSTGYRDVLLVAAVDQTPPLPEESFAGWRDRALADFVRPDLSPAARIAWFRDRFERVPDILSLDPGRGRGFLYVGLPFRFPQSGFGAQLLRDRAAAGDDLVPAKRGGTIIIPAAGVRRNDGFNDLVAGTPSRTGLMLHTVGTSRPGNRREQILARLERRNRRRAERHEDFSAYWARYGRDAIGVPKPEAQGGPTLFMTAAADAVPPWPGETFAAWRERGFADFIRPDLSAAERIARFRERLQRVPGLLHLSEAFGRWSLYLPRVRSNAPDFEAALLDDRRRAGDTILTGGPDGGTVVLPPLDLRDDGFLERVLARHRGLPGLPPLPWR